MSMPRGKFAWIASGVMLWCLCGLIVGRPSRVRPCAGVSGVLFCSRVRRCVAAVCASGFVYDPAYVPM